MKLRGHDLNCTSTIYSTHNQIVSTAGHAKWLSEFTPVRCMSWRICGRYCTNLAYVVKPLFVFLPIKFTQEQATKVQRRGYSSTLSLTSGLDKGGWSAPCTRRFTHWRETDTHCVGGWVGPKAGLNGCGNTRPPLGFDPRTVEPVASHYTD
jgi:hypothetical protein